MPEDSTDTTKSTTTIVPGEENITEIVNSLQTDPNAIFYNKSNDNRPYIDIATDTTDFSALVDTGAMISVIGYTNEDELHIWGEILECKTIITTIDRSAHPARGKIRTDFHFNGMTATATFVLVKTPHKQFIAGYDFCKIFGIELNVNENVRARLTRDKDSTTSSQRSEAAALDGRSNQEEDFERSTNQNQNTWTSTETAIGALLEILTISASAEPTTRDTTKQDKEIYEISGIRTAQGVDDTESDALPEKHTCVSEPHSLTTAQQKQLEEILAEFPYTPETGPLNCTTEYIQEINTGNAQPEIHRQYPLSPYVQEEINKAAKKLLDEDIIKRIEYSPWRWPILWVRKKTGGGRICVDARGLNRLTIPDAYPSLNADAILRNLPQARYISSIDMSQAFHQIPIRPEDQIKTTFAVGNNLYCYKRAIMGFRNSPADLTKLLDRVFRDLHPKVYHYVDDFIVVSETFEEHMSLLQEVAKRLREANLSISPTKSHFCHKRLTFLGYLLSEEGLQPNNERIQPILNYKKPETVRDIRRLMGLINWYRRFIPHAAELLTPLSNMISGHGKNSQHKIQWNTEAERAFEGVKQILTSEPILAMADYTKPFKIYSDASLTAGSAILTQNFDGQEKVIFYHSVKFTPTQQNYSATERELLSVLAGVEKFRPWVDGTQFEVVTDHASIKWLQNLKEPHGKLARWAVRLQAFDIRFIHRPGKDMELPDALSRAVALVDLKDIGKTKDLWYRATAKRAGEGHMPLYKVENGYLYRRSKINSQAGDRLWKLCLPKEFHQDAIREKHDESAHPGVWKTMKNIQNTYFWPTLHDDVYNYVTKCSVCRQAKPTNEPTHAFVGTYRDPGRVGRMISIDLIGKLPASKIHSHQYAVVAIDCFSKYVFTKSFVRASALNVADFVEKEIIFKFGAPEVIVCDNGAQFVSKTFDELLAKYHVRKLTTPLYFPQANPVEATNKTIKNALRAEIIARQAKHQDWASFMPFITMKLNTTPHTATEKSPHYIVFGHDKTETGNEHRILLDATPSLDDELDRRELIYDEAAEAQRAQHEENKKRYNLRATKRTFAVGDEVMIENKKLSNAGNKYAQKLAARKILARVKEAVGNDTYRLTDRNGNDLGKWHASMIYTR